MRIAIAAAVCCLLLSSLPASSANFTDSNYHQYLLYKMDQTEVDVLIMPSTSPWALRDVQLMQSSVQKWDAGINALAPAWLANGLNIHVYRVGLDPIPHSALWDPEVVIIPAELNYAVLAGIGLEPMNTLGVYYCHGQPPPAPLNSAQDIAALPGFHQHPGNSWGSVKVNAAGRGCANGGTTCFVVNTNFLNLATAANSRDMFDLNSHEFGHCLGIGHVGDALDFTAAAYPRDDIMSYENDGWDAGHILCVSTLDILGLQQIYGYLLGQSGYPINPSGGYVMQTPSAWSATSCGPDPVFSPYDTTVITNAHPVLAAKASASPTPAVLACPAGMLKLC
ncbi:MAG TPA: hypothetical protein VM241_09355 [Candidatus Thermoplasmatota archaeon]|nr:hypothetical protein [Candidatus Thermoplasmatota archaeon]